MIAGRGVQARIDGKQILAGNANYFSERNIELPSDMKKKASEYHEDGCTIVYVAVDGSAVGFVILADELRSDAATVVQAIDRLGIETILLTGDHKHAAEHIARQVGIDELRYDCLPETKMKTIADYKQKGQLLCMIGDGVNDAPALKTAHVGIAMGGIGSDIAIDAADIVLVSDEIKELPHLFMLARKTMGTIRINLTLSMLLNFAAILLAMTGILNPVVGALVHNVGSVAVIINSAFLLRWRSPMA